jgi:hypothetical protein
LAESFDSGALLFSTVGNDAKISNKEHWDGSYSLELRYASDTLVSYDVSSYQELKTQFHYLPSGANVGQKFVLEWSFDNGSTWTIVENFVRGVDWSANDQWYGVSVTWPVNANYGSVRFQFRSKFNNGNQRVYIDDILVEGK